MRRLSILVNDFDNSTNIDADDFEIKIFYHRNFDDKNNNNFLKVG